MTLSLHTMVPSALEFSSPPFPIWMMTTHPTAIISNINCSPKSWPKFPGTIISSFRFPNHFMEIFIIARTPLIIIYLLICLFIVLWILSELKRSLTYCIIQLNDWVKVSNYKLFLPENVGYLIQVNNYVYDDYFFFIIIEGKQTVNFLAFIFLVSAPCILYAITTST